MSELNQNPDCHLLGVCFLTSYLTSLVLVSLYSIYFTVSLEGLLNEFCRLEALLLSSFETGSY